MADPEQVTAAVARNVRAYRLSRNWTLEVLAARAGVSKGMLVQVEQGRTNPSIATLCRLADGLGITLARLVEVAEEPAIRVVEAADAVTLWQGMEGSRAKLMVGSDPPADVELWDWHIAVGDGSWIMPTVGGPGNFCLWWQERSPWESRVMSSMPMPEPLSFRADRSHEYGHGGAELLHFLMFVIANDLPAGEESRDPYG